MPKPARERLGAEDLCSSCNARTVLTWVFADADRYDPDRALDYAQRGGDLRSVGCTVENEPLGTDYEAAVWRSLDLRWDDDTVEVIRLSVELEGRTNVKSKVRC